MNHHPIALQCSLYLISDIPFMPVQCSKPLYFLSKWDIVSLSVIAILVLPGNLVGRCGVGSLIGGSTVSATLIDNFNEGNVEGAVVSTNNLLSDLTAVKSCSRLLTVEILFTSRQTSCGRIPSSLQRMTMHYRLISTSTQRRVTRGVPM